MNGYRFLQRYGQFVTGTLSGLDRIRFRGMLRLLSYASGMMCYLAHHQVLLKHFKDYACGMTERVRQATAALADKFGRPVEYLASSSTSKEEHARRIAERDGVREGLIGVLSCVEPCRTYEIFRNRQTQRLELRSELGQCLHYYFYYQHGQLGLMHARLQTWFPFTRHVCLNGREWLARQMDRVGLGYVRKDNCFVSVDDARRAQRLFDAQLTTDWPALLDRLVRQVHPTHRQIAGDYPDRYDWSADQTEWATDVMFRSSEALAPHYPRWWLHSVTHLGSRDVLRFLGRKMPAHRGLANVTAEVHTDLRERVEGTRVKHFANHNSVKMYDQQGQVLRIETTINESHDRKVFRPKEGDEQGPKEWRRLRHGVADLHRRAEISQAANERYLDTLATVDETTPLAELIKPLCQPTQLNGRRVRALNPLATADAALLEAVNRGEFLLTGFRNRDLVRRLYPETTTAPDNSGNAQPTDPEARRRSAAVTRKLRLLRAHGVIKKISTTHRYQLTPHGRTLVTTILAARQANTTKLLAAA